MILKKIMKITKFIIFFIWGLPQNLMGLCLYLYLYLYYKNKNKNKNCFEKNGVHYICIEGNGSGVSLGEFIIIWDSMPFSDTIDHEYGHTIQSRMLGPLYLLIIGIPSFIRCQFPYKLKNGKIYYNFYTEKWADELGKVNRKK